MAIRQTTTETEMSNEQIKALRKEAGAAGDYEMVEVCDRALAGDDAAIAECEKIIADAKAMED